MNEDYEFENPYEGLTEEEIWKLEKVKDFQEDLSFAKEKLKQLENCISAYDECGLEDEWNKEFLKLSRAKIYDELYIWLLQADPS